MSLKCYPIVEQNLIPQTFYFLQNKTNQIVFQFFHKGQHNCTLQEVLYFYFTIFYYHLKNLSSCNRKLNKPSFSKPHYPCHPFSEISEIPLPSKHLLQVFLRRSVLLYLNMSLVIFHREVAFHHHPVHASVYMCLLLQRL